MHYNAILWDLDGTLLDTLDDLRASVNAALSAYNYPARSRAEIRAFVGNGAAMLIRRALPRGASDEAAVLAAFRTHYDLHCADATAPYPGIVPLLRALHQRGAAMAVVSNKPDGAVKALCRRHFGDLISVAVGQGGDIRCKPAPDGVLRALSLLGVSPEQAVYIGDSEVDLATAAAAGLPCLSVGWGFRDAAVLRQLGAAQLAETPAALMSLLEVAL